MLNFSRSERYLILTLLTAGLLCTGLFYYKKTRPNQDADIIDIEGARPLVDINTADVLEFENLPGIGPVLASEIVRYRDAKRGFKSPEDLKEIKGIGEKKFEAIKDLIFI